jgi:uncharacterized OB-fold protein
MTRRWFPDAMPTPAVTDDTRPFFDAALEHRLVMQRCASCATFRHPPRPLCPRCGSFDVEWIELAGTGTLFTYSTVHLPFHPALRDTVPYVVAVVTLDGTGGTRMASNLVDAPIDQLRAGLAVECVWEDMSPTLTLPRFILRDDTTAGFRVDRSDGQP